MRCLWRNNRELELGLGSPISIYCLSNRDKQTASLKAALRPPVQIALKPASKGLGLHRIFIRGEGRKFVMADSTFKRMQIDAWACWLDAGEHHLGLALRTGGAPKCYRRNGGRRALRLGHMTLPLEQAGAQHSLSPVMPGRRGGDSASMRRKDLKCELIHAPSGSPA